MMIRSIFQAIEVVDAATPYNIIQLKVFYPVISGNAPAQSMGIIPAEPQYAPLGYEAGTILPLSDALPLMLIGGTCDGVIANNSSLYGVTWERPATPIERTFQAMVSGKSDRYLLLVEGANHFSIADPVDATTGISFLDFAATQPDKQSRNLIAAAIGLFIDAHVRDRSHDIVALEQLLISDDREIASWERK